MAEARLTGSRRLRAVLLGKWSIRLLVLLLLIVLALLGIPHLGRPVGLESVLSPGDPQGPPAILDERFSAVFETLTEVEFEVGTEAEVLLNGEGTVRPLNSDAVPL